MLAQRLYEIGRPLVAEEVPKPRAGSGECVIRVRAAGICASDLHFMAGEVPTGPLPQTLGHEIAGTVDEVGPGVEGLAPGDRVFVNPLTGCGDCAFCRRGEPNHCSQRRLLGVHVDGGLAEYVVAPAANLIVMPDSRPFAEIAMIESAGAARHALRLLGPLGGEVVAIMGAGGVGLHAVRLAVAEGATVISVDPDPVARERAADAGAARALDPSDDILAAARELEPERLIGVVDSVGLPSTFDVSLSLLRTNGICAVSGIGTRRLTLSVPTHFVRNGIRVSGVYGYTPADLAYIARLFVDGVLDFSSSVSATYPLHRVNEAIEAFVSRVGSPVRVVVTTD
ncbi:alcohol dehydrogenase catalytic domain-containing protein [Microbacterium sp. KHB019]|uniref:alcohol dehydrogenase catalytic domain-containing protein n=1 Tax=Microbacterium sp. KHB019 TaxID=3129770 RepID=UPI003078F7A8